MTQISGHTKVVTLVGSPVEHSLSPAMHNLSFTELGIDAVYVVADVTPDTLADAITGARALGVAGLNVTMPCKTHVLQYLDELSPAAELMGAVNTIVNKDGTFIGHNTDGAGALRAIAEAGHEIAGAKLVVLGAGGAGSAIFTQAALDGAAHIDVFNVRDQFFDSTRERLISITERTGTPMELNDLDDKALLEAKVRAADIIVDATRIGMEPFENESNVAKEWMHSGQVVMDTVYHPRVTKLLSLAKEAGATPVEGLGMLLWQAAIGEEIWFDASMPIDVVREAVFPQA
ncbi:shikimate dehydrogenase [Arcanobacterium haemolyticum]|nr:shikimate dehydrogenase [Arcanobacterium haemolyticum]